MHLDFTLDETDPVGDGGNDLDCDLDGDLDFDIDFDRDKSRDLDLDLSGDLDLDLVGDLDLDLAGDSDLDLSRDNDPDLFRGLKEFDGDLEWQLKGELPRLLEPDRSDLWVGEDTAGELIVTS